MSLGSPSQPLGIGVAYALQREPRQFPKTTSRNTVILGNANGTLGIAAGISMEAVVVDENNHNSLSGVEGWELG